MLKEGLGLAHDGCVFDEFVYELLVRVTVEGEVSAVGYKWELRKG